MKKKYQTSFFCVLMVGIILLSLGCSNNVLTAEQTTTSKVVSQSEHAHTYKSKTIAASCAEKGYTVFTCACGDTYTGNETDALGHDNNFSAVPVTNGPEGYMHYTCNRCHEECKEKFTVYSDAKIDYLLPFDPYSRARKHNPEFVMIHFISAVVLSKEDPYNMKTIRSIFEDYEVSVHYIIDRDGTISCYIPEDLVAFHAGSGTWAGDPKYTNLLNNYAIGIEVVAMGSQKDMAQYLSPSAYQSLDPSLIGYTDEQYDSLKKLVNDICKRNNIPMDRDHIIGHEEYSPQKTDPGELFDWDRLLS